MSARSPEQSTEGEERTVGGVSGTCGWHKPAKPKGLLFGLDRRERKHNFSPARTGAGWKVVMDLCDWVDIAVIE